MEDGGAVARDKIFTKIMFPMLKLDTNIGIHELFHKYSDFNIVNMFCVLFCFVIYGIRVAFFCHFFSFGYGMSFFDLLFLIFPLISQSLS